MAIQLDRRALIEAVGALIVTPQQAAKRIAMAMQTGPCECDYDPIEHEAGPIVLMECDYCGNEWAVIDYSWTGHKANEEKHEPTERPKREPEAYANGRARQRYCRSFCRAYFGDGQELKHDDHCAYSPFQAKRAIREGRAWN